MTDPDAAKNACQVRIEDFEERKKQFEKEGLEEQQLNADHVLHRLIRDGEIEESTGAPKARIFTDKSLSLEATGPGFPSEDQLKDLIKERNASLAPEKAKFIGSYIVDKNVFPSDRYRTHHDPFPLLDGTKQTYGHVQIFCNKGKGVGREAVNNGRWSVKPEDLEGPTE